MSIQRKLFKAILSTFSKEELKELKDYWHLVFKDFGSKHGLNSGKLNVYFSRCAGASTPNTLAGLADPTKTAKETLDALSDHDLYRSLLSDYVIDYQYIDDDDVHMNVPILEYKVLDEEGTTHTLIVIIDMLVKIDGKDLYVETVPYILHENTSEYIDVNSDFEMTHNFELYIQDDLDFGIIKDKYMHPIAGELLSVNPDSYPSDHGKFLSDVSMILIRETLQAIRIICNKKGTITYGECDHGYIHVKVHTARVFF